MLESFLIDTVYLMFNCCQHRGVDRVVDDRVDDRVIIYGYGSKKGTKKNLLLNGKIDQNLWSPLGFLTQSHSPSGESHFF